jgi:hypothetical protein
MSSAGKMYFVTAVFLLKEKSSKHIEMYCLLVVATLKCFFLRIQRRQASQPLLRFRHSPLTLSPSSWTLSILANSLLPGRMS